METLKLACGECSHSQVVWLLLFFKSCYEREPRNIPTYHMQMCDNLDRTFVLYLKHMRKTLLEQTKGLSNFLGHQRPTSQGWVPTGLTTDSLSALLMLARRQSIVGVDCFFS